MVASVVPTANGNVFCNIMTNISIFSWLQYLAVSINSDMNWWNNKIQYSHRISFCLWNWEYRKFWESWIGYWKKFLKNTERNKILVSLFRLTCNQISWGFMNGGCGSRIHPSYTASGLISSSRFENRPILLSTVYWRKIQSVICTWLKTMKGGRDANWNLCTLATYLPSGQHLL